MFIPTKRVITEAAAEDIALVKNARGHVKYWQEKEKCYAEFAIKEYFAQCDELITNEGLIYASYTPVQQTRLDTTALKADHPGIYEQYSVKAEYRRFIIK